MGKLFETDMMQIDDVIIRALVSLIVLFFLTKLLGKKQISQLSLFDYVIGISIGNFAAEMTTNVEIQFINGIIAVTIFGLVAYLVSIGTMKSFRLRKFFMGIPTVLIENGKLYEKSLKKTRLDMNDLLEQLRIKGYFDISQIEYCMLEANGDVSILPKQENKPVTSGDMQIKIPQERLCANVVIDGNIMHSNLKGTSKDENWLNHELKVKGYSDLSKILLATLDNNGKLNIFERNKNEDPKQLLE
jgi:Predicted membrane protein